jgi:hypothetical protein
MSHNTEQQQFYTGKNLANDKFSKEETELLNYSLQHISPTS